MKKKKKILGVFLICMTLSSCGNVTSYKYYEDNEKYEALTTHEKEFDSIHNMEISYLSGSVEVKASSVCNKLTIKETASKELDDSYLAHYYVSEEAKLNVHYCESGLTSLKQMDKKLEILIPYNYSFEEVTLNIVSGDINVDGLISDILNVNSTSGLTNVSNCAIENININSTTGLNYIKALNTTKKISINKTSGSAVVVLKKDVPGFSLSFNRLSGEFECDFESADKDGLCVYGNQEMQITVNSTSGDLSIIKDEK